MYEAFAPLIAAETDAIINIAGSAGASLDERLAYPLSVKPELCSLDMGSMNLAFHKAARGVVNWKHRLGEALCRGLGGRRRPQLVRRHS